MQTWASLYYYSKTGLEQQLCQCPPFILKRNVTWNCPRVKVNPMYIVLLCFNQNAISNVMEYGRYVEAVVSIYIYVLFGHV